MIVVEIADGVFQQETKAILYGSRIRDRLDGILFAAPLWQAGKTGLPQIIASSGDGCGPLALTT